MTCWMPLSYRKIPQKPVSALKNRTSIKKIFTFTQNGANLSSEGCDDTNGDAGDGAGKGGSSNEEIEARVEGRLKTSLSSRVVLHRLEVGHSCDYFCQLCWRLFLSHLEVSTVLNNHLSGHIKFASKARHFKSKKYI